MLIWNGMTYSYNAVYGTCLGSSIPTLLGSGYSGIHGYVNTLTSSGARTAAWADVLFPSHSFWCLMMSIFIGSWNELTYYH